MSKGRFYNPEDELKASTNEHGGSRTSLEEFVDQRKVDKNCCEIVTKELANLVIVKKKKPKKRKDIVSKDVDQVQEDKDNFSGVKNPNYGIQNKNIHIVTLDTFAPPLPKEHGGLVFQEAQAQTQKSYAERKAEQAKAILVKQRQQKQKKMEKINSPNKTSQPIINILAFNANQISVFKRPMCRKDQGREYFKKLQARGKSWQAIDDLARLAIVKKEREQAKERRELEAKEKEDAAKQKAEQIQNTLKNK